MSGEPKSLDDMRAAVVAAKQKKDAEEQDRRVTNEYERLQLAERFEKDLGGKEHEQFEILDMTLCGEGFFVVKLAPSIVWKTYWESKMTTVDQCDLVSGCIVHPPKDDYLAARNRRQGIDAELTKLVGRLNGLHLGVEQGK